MSDLRIRFLCTNCGKRLRAKPGYAGSPIRCPGCKAIQVAPKNIEATDGSELATQINKGDDIMGSTWRERVDEAERTTNLEKLFRLLTRGVHDLHTECLRFLNNDKLSMMQKEQLVRSQVESFRQEVAKFRNVVQTDLKNKEREMGRLQAANAIGGPLHSLREEARHVDMVIRIFFGEERPEIDKNEARA